MTDLSMENPQPEAQSTVEQHSPETMLKIVRSVLAAQEAELADAREKIAELEQQVLRGEMIFKAEAAKDLAVLLSVDNDLTDELLDACIDDGFRIGAAIAKKLRQESNGEDVADHDEGTIN